MSKDNVVDLEIYKMTKENIHRFQKRSNFVFYSMYPLLAFYITSAVLYFVDILSKTTYTWVIVAILSLYFTALILHTSLIASTQKQRKIMWGAGVFFTMLSYGGIHSLFFIFLIPGVFLFIRIMKIEKKNWELFWESQKRNSQ
ncbi:hypothetical protein JMA_38960 (plasmid) [Jeotgalibacillus malaysiensis]|uniref:Uncharacterized protein n=1 Tax=Jeotgalibacillus malaysiensis TaxID=1508404 RepID=A0A0B5AZ12_9BACL|nr:hypothetical protein [Jeotgalibacillus malaysiensis]AJD93214.1 hypothetical protein JMA_38960 [Jeotgalibacillus malaysiensis]